MKSVLSLTLLLLLASGHAAAQDSEAELAAKVSRLSALTGLYALEMDNADGGCPDKMRVVIRTETEIEFAALGETSSLIFKSIDSGKEKIQISSKESFELKSELSEADLRLEGRLCRNKIFKKCNDWQTLSMVFWSEDGLAVSNRESPFLTPSGFPSGTCTYKKGLF